jgi:hypothetical protein
MAKGKPKTKDATDHGYGAAYADMLPADYEPTSNTGSAAATVTVGAFLSALGKKKK